MGWIGWMVVLISWRSDVGSMHDVYMGVDRGQELRQDYYYYYYILRDRGFIY